MSERGCLSFWLREPRRTGFEEMYGRVRVAELIRREFGVSYHPAHVSRLLKKLRLSLQKPERRANQRDEEAEETVAQLVRDGVSSSPSLSF
jgi:transposase